MAAPKKEGKPAADKPRDPKDVFKKWDSAEVTKDQFVSYAPAKDGSIPPQGAYPLPNNRFRVILEGPNASIEGIYFWSLTQFRQIGYPLVDKISDVFSASESSSLFGAGQQRLGLTQDRVMQFLRIIHDMVRSIPVYVRELRAIRERLGYYYNSSGKFAPWEDPDGIKAEEGKKPANADSAEITLKGMYVDLVEGGAKSPASVFGLSQQLSFAVLPDLFFQTRKFPGESDDTFWARVGKLENDFNPSVVTTLKRKLTQYYTWKEHSQRELVQRRNYLLKYMRQYYSTIKLYMQWVKPYLRTVKRLGLDIERNSRAELIRAFETSLVEIEVLARKAEKDTDKKYGKGAPYNCILMTFQYRTKPSMSITTSDFQHRGPVHVGEAEVTWRSYAWSEEHIAAYKRLKEQEDIDLLKGINETLKFALEGVEEDLQKFLDEADKEAFGKPAPKEEKPRVPSFEGFFEPAAAVFSGAREAIGAVVGGTGDIAKSFWPGVAKGAPGSDDMKRAFDSVNKISKKLCYLHYKNFKKSYGMQSW
jgi:hypothetical protein